MSDMNNLGQSCLCRHIYTVSKEKPIKYVVDKLHTYIYMYTNDV